MKRSAKAVGFDPADYAAIVSGRVRHRSSFRGVSEWAIMRQTGHKSLTTFAATFVKGPCSKNGPHKSALKLPTCDVGRCRSQQEIENYANSQRGLD